MNMHRISLLLSSFAIMYPAFFSSPLVPLPAHLVLLFLSPSQNASADVEKMILGNKCDLQESRVVSTERGRLVSER